MAGAEYHEAKQCTNKHFLRTILFAFFQYGLSDLKQFITEQLGVLLWGTEDLDAYVAWLTAQPGNDVPNHIKLYWWILMFWGRLPR